MESTRTTYYSAVAPKLFRVINFLVTAEGSQRTGVETLLVEAAEERARSQGVTPADLR